VSKITPNKFYKTDSGFRLLLAPCGLPLGLELLDKSGPW